MVNAYNYYKYNNIFIIVSFTYKVHHGMPEADLNYFNIS